VEFPEQASWPRTPSALPLRFGCLALLRKQLVHAVCSHLREQFDNAFITSEGNGSADQILDGGLSFGLHPSPGPMGYASFGSRSFLTKIEGQASRFDPFSQAYHLIMERENHRPHMACNT